jgi:hypothetical protein
VKEEIRLHAFNSRFIVENSDDRPDLALNKYGRP